MTYRCLRYRYPMLLGQHLEQRVDLALGVVVHHADV